MANCQSFAPSLQSNFITFFISLKDPSRLFSVTLHSHTAPQSARCGNGDIIEPISCLNKVTFLDVMLGTISAVPYIQAGARTAPLGGTLINTLGGTSFLLRGIYSVEDLEFKMIFPNYFRKAVWWWKFELWTEALLRLISGSTASSNSDHWKII